MVTNNIILRLLKTTFKSFRVGKCRKPLLGLLMKLYGKKTTKMH